MSAKERKLIGQILIGLGAASVGIIIGSYDPVQLPKSLWIVGAIVYLIGLVIN